ncbi:MAG: hypothetical protein KDC38_04065, partial [Planctomycetes bacterium]|nr:hypothetical protein [Planctomycetota bacterium]
TEVDEANPYGRLRGPLLALAREIDGRWLPLGGQPRWSIGARALYLIQTAKSDEAHSALSEAG